MSQLGWQQTARHHPHYFLQFHFGVHFTFSHICLVHDLAFIYLHNKPKRAHLKNKEVEHLVCKTLLTLKNLSISGLFEGCCNSTAPSTRPFTRPSFIYQQSKDQRMDSQQCWWWWWTLQVPDDLKSISLPFNRN